MLQLMLATAMIRSVFMMQMGNIRVSMLVLETIQFITLAHIPLSLAEMAMIVSTIGVPALVSMEEMETIRLKAMEIILLSLAEMEMIRSITPVNMRELMVEMATIGLHPSADIRVSMPEAVMILLTVNLIST